MAKLRYYDAGRQMVEPEALPAAAHSEFLRTGKITRDRPHWLAEERRYMSHEEVAQRTARRLQSAGEKTHERINGFHRLIQFPKMIFHRTLKDSPHLGYCHVTASRTKFAQFETVNWAFYIANFYAELGSEDEFFEKVDLQYNRMYFAVAMQADHDASDKKMKVDRAVRGNGILFRTHDPDIAIKNVLLLGARNEQLREIIRQL